MWFGRLVRPQGARFGLGLESVLMRRGACPDCLAALLFELTFTQWPRSRAWTASSLLRLPFTQWLRGRVWTGGSPRRLPYTQWLRGRAWIADSLFRLRVRAIAGWALPDGRFAAQAAGHAAGVRLCLDGRFAAQATARAIAPWTCLDLRMLTRRLPRVLSFPLAMPFLAFFAVSSSIRLP